MVLDRQRQTVDHRHFYDILEYLQPGRLPGAESTQGSAGQAFGVKEGTGAKIEFLLIKRLEEDRWGRPW